MKNISFNGHTLVSECTVSPDFDFKDFELPTQEELLAKFLPCNPFPAPGTP